MSKIKIENVDKFLRGQIDSSRILKMLFEEFGAILAGGTAHALSKGISIEKQLKSNPTSDIDLYFSNQKMYHAAVNKLTTIESSVSSCKFLIEKSVSGLCHNIYPQNYNFESAVSEAKIQLVGCIFGKPEDVITSFDFRNLEVCYYIDKGRYVKLSTNNFEKLDNLLDVRHNRSPFLMHRIYKYITYRGYQGVTDRSREIITDWIVKAATGYYSDNRDGCPSLYVDILNTNSFKRLLKKSNIISDEDLTFLIGKVTEDVYEQVETYNSRGYRNWSPIRVGKKDIAVEEIRNRR